MEIGSFIELDLRKTGDYYNGDNVARLNAARTGIYHASRLLSCSTVYLPYYLCSVVKNFLIKKKLNVKYYYISDNFQPLIQEIESDAAIVLVNYFGILSSSYLSELSNRYKNVIIDNCAAFYSKPVKNCYNVYSPRKFFGVPDGCYVIGKNSSQFTEEYDQDFSSHTSSFLLKRIELGASLVYSERMLNEKRIDESDVFLMSTLTNSLLNSIDYTHIKNKRRANFNYAHELYSKINKINPIKFMDENSIPMVYPLVIEDETIVGRLINNDIYTGRWWVHVINMVPINSFEAKLSKFMVPLPIDQRYDFNDLKSIYNSIQKIII